MRFGELPPGSRFAPGTEREAEASVTSLGGTFNRIVTLSDSISSAVAPGLAGRGEAAGKAFLEGLAQTDPRFAEYDSLVDSTLSAFARTRGEKGSISDTDVERIRPMFPGTADTPAVAQRKLSNAFRAMNDRLSAIGAPPLPEPPALSSGFKAGAASSSVQPLVDEAVEQGAGAAAAIGEAGRRGVGAVSAIATPMLNKYIATNPQGVTIYSLDGRTWYDAAGKRVQ
jgi:hypothetical protein